MPNLVQTLEGQPAFVHCGPFANIAHGNSSLIADRIALKMADYVITESGFGADMGMQKFMDIVCRQGGIRPAAVVVVATVRRCALHGGSPDGSALVARGVAAAAARGHRQPRGAHPHGAGLRHARASSPSTASRTTPTRKSSSCARSRSRPVRGRTAQQAVVDGGEGAADLARAVVKAANTPATSSSPTPTTRRSRTRSRRSRPRSTAPTASSSCPRPEAKLERFTELGYGSLPICMAKTHLSISHDPSCRARRPASRCRSRPPRVHRRGLRDGAVRRRSCRCRASARPGGPQHRHRRRRAHGRAVLAWVARTGVSGSFRRQPHPREGRKDRGYLINHPSVEQASASISRACSSLLAGSTRRSPPTPSTRRGSRASRSSSPTRPGSTAAPSRRRRSPACSTTSARSSCRARCCSSRAGSSRASTTRSSAIRARAPSSPSAPS